MTILSNTDIMDIRDAVASGDERAFSEALNRVEQMFAYEDQGWAKVSGLAGNTEDGPTLDQLKEWSRSIKEDIAGSPLIKRAVGLRSSYVFSKGVNIPGFEYAPTAGTDVKRGRKANKERFFNHPVNRRTLFSPAAYETFEASASSEGLIAFLPAKEKGVQVFRPVPLREIAGAATHPDHPSEVIAYLREWSSTTFDKSGVPRTEQRRCWYFTDTFTGDPGSVVFPADVEVDRENRIFVQLFNTQVGWMWGVPDALAASAWSRLYTELMNYGRAMTKTMAKYALALKTERRQTREVQGRQVAGGVANIGRENELTALSTAGKTYDFDGIRPVASMVATAMEVSVVHLLSDPGAAGSSYGSAQNLDLPTKRAIVARQDLWASFFERIVEYGTGAEVRVSFPPLDDPDPYREMQVVMLGVNSGLIHPEEARPRVLKLGQFEDRYPEAPTEDELPVLLQMGSVDGVNTVTVSPDQGRSNGAGGVDSALANDQRDDTIS